MTRKRRKKVMEMREFSSAFWKPLATGGAVNTAGEGEGGALRNTALG
jgi:hypothetical protein